MRDTLLHRGPDGSGLYIRPDRRAGIASTRLAIRDLSRAGDQPWVDFDQGIAVVFNGEIYNANSLAADLKHRGVLLQSNSDTEVVLRLYCVYGESFLSQLNGIFAIAISDLRRDTLLLARDHIGVKPLYFVDYRGTLAFASEIKALVKADVAPHGVDEEMISSYLTFACCPGPRTLIKDVQKLPPATLLRARASKPLRSERYWQPIKQSLIQSMSTATPDECVALVRQQLSAAVEAQLVGDVDPTCSLSGGVDSSAVASLMSRYSSKNLTFFSIGFPPDWAHYNEFEYARAVARRCGARLIEIRTSPEDILDFLENTYADCCDDPNADPVCGLAYRLSSEMRRCGFKVALSGEGSDEIFLGYARYMVEMDNWTRDISSGATPDQSYWGLAIPFRGSALETVFSAARSSTSSSMLPDAVLRSHSEALQHLAPNDVARRTSLLELQIRLPELLLMRVDKMGMANSMECRVPFLDKDLVETVLAIPREIKIRNRNPKSLLKDAVEDYIPEQCINRPKMGFSLPIAEWFRDRRFSARIHSLLFQTDLMRSGALNAPAVSELLQQHVSGATDWSFQLWTLLCLCRWHERWH